MKRLSCRDKRLHGSATRVRSVLFKKGLIMTEITTADSEPNLPAVPWYLQSNTITATTAVVVLVITLLILLFVWKMYYPQASYEMIGISIFFVVASAVASYAGTKLAETIFNLSYDSTNRKINGYLLNDWGFESPYKNTVGQWVWMWVSHTFFPQMGLMVVTVMAASVGIATN